MTCGGSPFSPLFIAAGSVTRVRGPLMGGYAHFQSAFHRGRECNIDSRSQDAALDAPFSPLFIAAGSVTPPRSHAYTLPTTLSVRFSSRQGV